MSPMLEADDLSPETRLVANRLRDSFVRLELAVPTLRRRMEAAIKEYREAVIAREHHLESLNRVLIREGLVLDQKVDLLGELFQVGEPENEAVYLGNTPDPDDDLSAESLLGERRAEYRWATRVG